MKRLIKSAIRIHLPYCLHLIPGGKYALLNRQYSPLGDGSFHGTVWGSSNELARAAPWLTKDMAARMSYKHSFCTDKVYFYNDDLCPWEGNRKTISYLIRLSTVSKTRAFPEFSPGSPRYCLAVLIGGLGSKDRDQGTSSFPSDIRWLRENGWRDHSDAGYLIDPTRIGDTVEPVEYSPAEAMKRQSMSSACSYLTENGFSSEPILARGLSPFFAVWRLRDSKRRLSTVDALIVALGDST